MGRTRGDEKVNDFRILKLLISSVDLLLECLSYKIKFVYKHPSNRVICKDSINIFTPLHNSHQYLDSGKARQNSRHFHTSFSHNLLVYTILFAHTETVG